MGYLVVVYRIGHVDPFGGRERARPVRIIAHVYEWSSDTGKAALGTTGIQVYRRDKLVRSRGDTFAFGGHPDRREAAGIGNLARIDQQVRVVKRNNGAGQSSTRRKRRVIAINLLLGHFP
jgi:hypothetical protein